MRSGSLSMSTRRAFFVMVIMALLCGASGMRAQQAAAPAAQPADQLKFSTVAALIVWQVKPDMEAGFESAWGAIKTKLSASDKPDLKELGESIKIFKVNVSGAPAGSPVAYVFQLNPPSKTLSYDPSKILYAPGMWERAEADSLFKKIADALVTFSVLPLDKVGM